MNFEIVSGITEHVGSGKFDQSLYSGYLVVDLKPFVGFSLRLDGLRRQSKMLAEGDVSNDSELYIMIKKWADKLVHDAAQSFVERNFT